MKAPAFSYSRPRQLHEVLTLLAEHGDEARLLAGGQTLLATLNMRLSGQLRRLIAEEFLAPQI